MIYIYIYAHISYIYIYIYISYMRYHIYIYMVAQEWPINSTKASKHDFIESII